LRPCEQWQVDDAEVYSQAGFDQASIFDRFIDCLLRGWLYGRHLRSFEITDRHIVSDIHLFTPHSALFRRGQRPEVSNRDIVSNVINLIFSGPNALE
jgi:hypothetical protein